MKAAQLSKYDKNFKLDVNNVAIPTIKPNEVLVKVKMAAVNPLETLIGTGSIKLIQDYDMPVTMGNELTGIVENVGKAVANFKKGDAIYSRLPSNKSGLLQNMSPLTVRQLHGYQKIWILVPEQRLP